MVSVEEYLSTAFETDCDYVDGELIERNMGELDHSGVQGWIFALLFSQRSSAGIHLFPETRVQVSAVRYRVPDISVTTRRVTTSGAQRRILCEPPFLCVEILSPEDRMSRVEERIEDLLAFGVTHVWLVDPQRRKAWTYTSAVRHEVPDLLTTTEPFLSVSLKEVFRSLEEDVESEQP